MLVLELLAREEKDGVTEALWNEFLSTYRSASLLTSDSSRLPEFSKQPEVISLASKLLQYGSALPSFANAKTADDIKASDARAFLERLEVGSAHSF